jgi:Rrf2 family transcriptional regulator, iron-sulfur cluster assembly transcription factor
MQITRAGEYAMLGLLALARRPLGEAVLLDVIAREEQIPSSFLGKIFQTLTKAGYVRSARGSKGGFSLLRSPETVTVLEVIEAIEGKIAFQRCQEEKPDCTHMGGCSLCGLFAEAQDKVKEVFARTTLAKLAANHTGFAEHQRQHGLTGPKHQPGKLMPERLIQLSRKPQTVN